MADFDDLKFRLRNNVDLVQLAERYIPSLKRAGSTFKGLCPFHEEKTPSFVIYPEKNHYICFGCGQSGDIFKFVMEIERLEFIEAMIFLGRQC
ncbi:MAG: DNA primase, partial [Lentisphaerae bacterium]